MSYDRKDAPLRSLAKRGDIVAAELLELKAREMTPGPQGPPGEIPSYLDAGLWTDIQGDVSQGTNQAALTYENFRDTGFKMYFMRHNQADELNFVFQMPHEWDPTTQVRPHVHVIWMADPLAEQTAFFDVKYCWTKMGGTVPALTGWTTTTLSHAVQPGDVYKEAILSIGLLSPPQGTIESSILLFQLIRNTASDTYETAKDHGTGTANIALLSVDVHYQVAKLGSVAEVPT